MTEQEVNTATLHLAALAHADRTECREESDDDRDEDDEHRQTDARVALQTDTLDAEVDVQ